MDDRTRVRRERERIQSQQVTQTATVTGLAVFAAATAVGSIIGEYATRTWFGKVDT